MLTVKNVSKRFGKIMALNGVDLQLEPGTYGLIGPNGSGKTTLFRCVMGLLKPDSGSIEKPQHCGYLPQSFGVDGALSVYETLEYYAAIKKIPVKQQKAAIEEAVEAVNLSDRLKSRTGTLSGGMVRRLGIAQALLGDPQLILFDEPTAGLDPEERMRFKLLLTRLKKKGVPLIISTHIVEDVWAVCDQVVVLRKGRVLKQCKAEELSAMAEGKVYAVPTDRQADLTEPYLPVRSELIDGREAMRVVSALEQPGKRVEPILEDGYLCVIHDLL